MSEKIKIKGKMKGKKLFKIKWKSVKWEWSKGKKLKR